MNSSEKIKLVCTRESFSPSPMSDVRWLAPQADYYRMQHAILARNAEPPSLEEWLDWNRLGYSFCAALNQGVILAYAAVLKNPESAWELTGVRTLDAHQRKGHGKSVSVFITAYILKEKPLAVCNIENANSPMLHLAEGLGYLQMEDPA